MGCLLKANGLYSRTTVGAVLLAAGAGARLDGGPKALLELGGVPLAVRLLVALSGAGVDELALVLDDATAEVEAAVAAFPITLVRCADAAAPRAAVARLGLQALSPRLDAVIVLPAELPLLDAADIVALISAFKKRAGAALVLPREVQDTTGPFMIDAALRDEWLAGAADPAGAAWRAANAARLCAFDAGSRRFAMAIDGAGDLERFAAATGHRLAWPAGSRAPA